MMPQTINLKEILRGVTPGRMQAVGAMQVIPLVSEVSDDNFIVPSEALVSTTDYGTLVIENPDRHKKLILPMNAAYVTKHRAQDHGMATTGLIHGKKTFRNAMCIEETQGGKIPRDKHKMGILPFPLREIAFNKRSEHGYSKLWNDIKNFHESVGVRNTSAELKHFLKQFEKEMDQFVAEFELVPQQIGAIILINGAVVGVERTPSYEYWQSVWEPLIRQCYGAVAIKAAQNSDFSIDKNRIPLKGKAKSLDDLVNELEEVRTKEEDQARDLVRSIVDEELKQSNEETVGELALDSLDHERFSGQIVRNDMSVVYASLVTKEKWVRNADWLKQEQFSI
jgi:hypothetical protein